MKALWDAFLRYIILVVVAPIRWTYFVGLFHNGKYWSLVEDDYSYLRSALKPNYFIILTNRKTHLTTYLTMIGTFFTQGKLSKWSHAFINVDAGASDLNGDFEYVFLESTAIGVHYATFPFVFDCDAVALVLPKGMSAAEWTAVIDRCVSENGKPYDALFQYNQDKSFSCVELVREGLMSLPDYQTRFANFEAMIAKTGYLTPQMFADCPDFEIFWQIRR
jgi:hypothetical protein